MKVTYGKNGIRISKLFKSKEVSYSDIKSVILSGKKYTLTTRAGEIIKSKCDFLCEREPLYAAIKKYNIYFRDEDELREQEKVYSGDELNQKIARAQAVIKDIGGNLIRKEMGDEYDIDSVVKDEGAEINVYFRLLKNGKLVKNIPEEAKFDSTDIEPYAFDNFVFALLVQWDGYGKYAVMDDGEVYEEDLTMSLEYLFEHYKKS